MFNTECKFTRKLNMTKTSLNFKTILFALTVASFVSGCASVAVSSDAIEKNTATTLGLAKNDFTISNRADDGVKTTYLVKTNAGKQYNCYVTGTITITGRAVSDAICNEIKGSVSQPISTPKTTSTPSTSTAPSSTPSCNALLKAAGKC